MSTTTKLLGNIIDSVLEQVEPDAILGKVGLERRRSSGASVIPPVAALGAGLAAGVYAEDVLIALGLRRPRSIAPGILAGIGILATGAIVGAGMGMAFAPSSGRDLRAKTAKRIGELKQQLMEAGEEIVKAVPTTTTASTSPTKHATAQNHAG